MLTLRATTVTAIILATCLHAQTPTPTPTPSPSPSPSATPAPKHLDVEWRASLGAADNSSTTTWLAIGDAHVFVSTDGGTVTAYNASDGQKTWSWADPCVVPPVLAGANLAIVTNDSLIALDQVSGQARWRVPIEGTGAPVLAFGSADRIAILVEGGIQTWDASGKSAWRAAFTGRPVTNVATAGPLLVFGTDTPSLVALDASSGSRRWEIPLPTKPRPLAATAERIYFGGDDGSLYSYGTDGKQKWEFRRRPLAVGPPVVDERTVYFTLLDNSIRGFVPGGGTEKSDQVLESRPLVGPLRLQDTLGIPLTSGRVAEVSIKTGKAAAPAPAAPGPAIRLLAAAPATDGSRVYTVTIANDFARTLAAWAHAAGETKR